MHKLLFPLLLVGCTTITPVDDDPSLVGRAEAVINTVPPSVGCVQIAAGTRITNVDTTPGQTVTVQLTRLPIGSVTFSALAFASGCAAVTSSSTADWASDPVTATIAVGQLAQVSLLLKPGGNASVGISFDTDAPDMSHPPDLTCVPFPKSVVCEGLVCGNLGDGCGGTYNCGTCAGKCCFDSCVPPNSFCP
jgi:hypothetical protein